MTFINVNFDEAVEPQAAPAGRYNLQITEAKVVKTGPNSKTPDQPQYRVTIGFPDYPEYQNFSHFVSLPNEMDEAGSAKFKALLYKRFFGLFNVPYDHNGIDLERDPMNLVGATAFAEVKLSEPNDNGDVYNSVVVPRLRNEPQRGR